MVLSRELIDVALNAVVALSVFLPQYFVANASSYPEYGKMHLSMYFLFYDGDLNQN